MLGGLLAWLKKRNLVVHLHDLLTEEHFSPMNLKVLGFFVRRAGLVIANSKATAESFTAIGGKPSLVEVVYNGFEPSSFARRADFSKQRYAQNLAFRVD